MNGADQAAETALFELLAVAWDRGHRTRRALGPDNCRCGAHNESECGCGCYGSNVITVNPYRSIPPGQRKATP